ncbi:MAG: hypothetical protein ACI9XO_001021 [Paraglaciecola sp.]|jgi:hypothetical protein
MNINQQNTQHFGNRLLDIVKLFPKRITRLFLHFWNGPLFFISKNAQNQLFIKSIAFWWWELSCHILELFGIAEWYEAACGIYKKETRLLNAFELVMAKEIFGNTINYARVRIDETAEIACKKSQLKYVSFYTINSWGRMSDYIFIHEMVHVWQYQKFGAVYIPKALKVHLTKGMGYNYGGLLTLQNAMNNNGKFLDFNFEQQGDIVADYFRIRCGDEPIWGNATDEYLPVYEYFIAQLME